MQNPNLTLYPNPALEEVDTSSRQIYARMMQKAGEVFMFSIMFGLGCGLPIVWERDEDMLESVRRNDRKEFGKGLTRIYLRM